VAWIAAGVCALAAFILALLVLRGGSASEPELRLDIGTPPTISPASFALSPDGRRIAYVATVDGVSRLWVRAFNSTTAEPVPGTENARNPFWSPDGNSLGFLVWGELQRVPLAGGNPQIVVPAIAPLGTQATWGANNTFLAAEYHKVTAVTFEGEKIVRRPVLTSKQMVYRAPRFLPGRKEFLFLADGVDAGIWLGSLAGTPPRRITAITPELDSAAEYRKGGWLVRVRENALVAQRFDSSHAELSGEPVTLAANVGVNPDTTAGAFSVSASGALAWRTGASTRRQLMWFDRSGHELGAFGPADPLVHNPEISPDGQRVALTRGRVDLSNLWIQEGSHRSRFTTNPAHKGIWSPDGKDIVFASQRVVGYDLYRKPADGVGPETPLLQSDVVKFPCSWSPDGRFIIYFTNENGGDLMVLPLDGDRKPFPFLSTPFREWAAVFSPDGKWVAYQSDETGRFEIYVRPFPGPGPARLVSTAGGSWARWRRDGKELYFLAPDSTLMAATVAVRGSNLETGAPQPLFRTHTVYFPVNHEYDVSRDGRFLIVTELESAPAEPIHVLLNWKPPSK
jgi:Tol biopolymer transport system component